MTDIEIAQAHEMKPITEIAAAAGIDERAGMLRQGQGQGIVVR